MKFTPIVIAALVFFLPVPAHAVFGGILGCGGAAAAGGAVTTAAAVGGALSVPVTDYTHIAVSTVTATQQTMETTKECILDGLTVALREALIASITESIVNWINSGFEGGPAFVTDLQGFLRDVADNTALDFIQGTELERLCSPFQLDIRLALAIEHQRTFRDRAECTLGDVVGNVEEFLAGDFSQGGWPAWFRLHADIQNNPYGAFIIAKAELNQRIKANQNEQEKLLEFGSGFFSKGKCRLTGTGGNHSGPALQTPPPSGGGLDPVVVTAQKRYDTTTRAGCTSSGGTWEVVTPGTQINAQLSSVLGSGLEQLQLADEIDEIINALLQQLASQIFTGLNGLRGLSSRDTNGASYLSRLVNEAEGGSVRTGRDALENDIDSLIDIEEEYQNILEDILDDLEEAGEAYYEVRDCYLELTTTISFDISTATALERANTASSTVAFNIVPQVNTRGVALRESIERAQTLEDLRAAAREAATVDGLNVVATEYDTLIQSGEFRTATDLLLLQNDRDAGAVALAELAALADEQASECRAF